ncbi:MAG TPA: hypothetical protein VK563_21800 [Puia sp.]|nr:hypothetical protein [Puia sp.]
MKLTIRALPVLLPAFFLGCFFLLFTACSKKDSPPVAGAHPPVTGPDPVVPPPPTGTACNAQKADAENIAVFPADNSWNQDISASPVDANSGTILSKYATSKVKADFGSGLYEGATIGIPFMVVCGSQQKIAIVYRKNAYDGNYGNESDPGPYPIPLNAPVEQSGDSHVIAVDKDNGILYELYNASVNGDHWEASSGAIFDLKSDKLRQDGWTSADAAGLPIFPGLVRYDEIVKGVIDHPIRFTLAKANTQAAHILPARHEGNGTGGTGALPFGAKIRLKASFDISTYPAHLQIILSAMKKYGLILADIGSNMYISGAPDERWDNDELQQLGNVKASDFEVIKLSQ